MFTDNRPLTDWIKTALSVLQTYRRYLASIDANDNAGSVVGEVAATARVPSSGSSPIHFQHSSFKAMFDVALQDETWSPSKLKQPHLYLGTSVLKRKADDDKCEEDLPLKKRPNAEC